MDSVDIVQNKLYSFLKARNKVPEGKVYNQFEREVRERIDNALNRIRRSIEESNKNKDENSLPNINEQDIQNVIFNEYPDQYNYFAIRDLQLVMEQRIYGGSDKAKNIFGMYKDDRIKELANICKSYEKNDYSFLLAESSRLFERNLQFEIPALYNQIERNNKETIELSKKIENQDKSKSIAENQYKRKCTEFNIDPSDSCLSFKDQFIRASAIKIDVKLDEILVRLRDDVLTKAMKYRMEFIAIIDRDHDSQGRAEIFHSLELQQLYNAQNLKSLKLSSELDEKETAASEVVHEIDWNIEIEKDASDYSHPVVEIKSLNESDPFKKHSLFSKDLRDTILDDLYELQGFLMRRIQEIKLFDKSGLTNQWYKSKGLSTSEQNILLIGINEIQPWLDFVDSTIKLFHEQELCNSLLALQNGPYVQRIEAELERLKNHPISIQNTIDQYRASQREITQNNESIKKRIEFYKAVTIRLKNRLEEYISKVFDGREVHIIGEVNNF